MCVSVMLDHEVPRERGRIIDFISHYCAHHRVDTIFLLNCIKLKLTSLSLGMYNHSLISTPLDQLSFNTLGQRIDQ